MHHRTHLALSAWLLSALIALTWTPDVASGHPSPGDLGFVQGTWTGVGYQQDGDSQTWTIALTADVAKKAFAIAYPSLNCGGIWTVEKIEPNRVWFRERITYGKTRCADGGRVVVTGINNTWITFSWFDAKGTLGAWSTLKKESP
ncbi:MAG: hypothetical protein CMH57_11750 [Myxococcales bacterium]|nr:hypothetical protein [Myxococcales bacterium]